jgi:hypothetical protein
MNGEEESLAIFHGKATFRDDRDFLEVVLRNLVDKYEKGRASSVSKCRS